MIVALAGATPSAKPPGFHRGPLRRAASGAAAAPCTGFRPPASGESSGNVPSSPLARRTGGRHCIAWRADAQTLRRRAVAAPPCADLRQGGEAVFGNRPCMVAQVAATGATPRLAGAGLRPPRGRGKRRAGRSRRRLAPASFDEAGPGAGGGRTARSINASRPAGYNRGRRDRRGEPPHAHVPGSSEGAGPRHAPLRPVLRDGPRRPRGRDVVEVRRPDGGDDVRRTPPFAAGEGETTVCRCGKLEASRQDRR